MAAHRCSHLGCVLLLFLSIILVTPSQETNVGNEQHAGVAGDPRAGAETKQTAEEPASDERRWEETEVKESQQQVSDTAELPPKLQAKEDFQEELVIRPLHSGDIYASFQFRTVWETDFMKGNKGKLVYTNIKLL